MKLLVFRHYTLGWAAVAFLAGCASQAPVGGGGAIPQDLPVVTHANARQAQYLYVADQWANRIDIFLRDDPGKGVADSISNGVSNPDGLWIDSAGNLYVANEDESLNDRVTVYAKGGHKPIRVYRGAILCASDVAVASDGTVYVADPCGNGSNGRVHVFAGAARSRPGFSFPTELRVPSPSMIGTICTLA